MVGRAGGQQDGQGGAYANALKQFQRVLTSKAWSPEPTSLASRGNVEQGFIDAAASAPALDPAQVAIARDIAGRRRGGDAPEPVAAARLAWVLIDKTRDAELRKEGLDLVRKAATADALKDE